MSEDISPNPLFNTEGTLDPKKTGFQYNRAFDISQDLNDEKLLNDEEFNTLEEQIMVKKKSDESKHSLNFTFESLSQGFINNASDPALKQILDEYKPESKEIDLDDLKNSHNFMIRKFPDALYFGECVRTQNGKNQRQGKGVMKYSNGRLYEGEWENDQRHGRGYERYPNSNIYQGEFQYGKAHGKGRYQWISTSEVYDGEWSKGMRHGYGVWKRVNKNTDQKFQDSYIGEWRNGKAEGYGVHTWCNGDRYEGEWKQCMKSGRGTDIFANGDKYSGQYKNGKPEGHGTYTWANGNYYDGEFIDGLKEGKGKWKKYVNNHNATINHNDSNTHGQAINKNQFISYEGDYKKDKKHGYGVFVWASGNTYKGQYKDDEREGNGEMKWTDGSCYIGDWIRGIQHGYGKIIYPDGTIKEGYFENNIYIGPIPRGEYVKQLQQQKEHQAQQPRRLTEEEERQQNMIFSPNSLAKTGLSGLDKSKKSRSTVMLATTPKANSKFQSTIANNIFPIDEETSQIMSSHGLNNNQTSKMSINGAHKVADISRKSKSPNKRQRNDSQNLSRESFNDFLRQTRTKVKISGKLIVGGGQIQGVSAPSANTYSLKNQQYLLGNTPLSSRKQRMMFQNGTTLEIQNPPSLNNTQQNALRRNASDLSRPSLNQQKFGVNLQVPINANNKNSTYLLQQRDSNRGLSIRNNMPVDPSGQIGLQTLKSSIPNLSNVLSRQSMSSHQKERRSNHPVSTSKRETFHMDRRRSSQHRDNKSLSQPRVR
ncbi:UNKNOWN [Stylonychia lemnae]|uniref:Morn repeat protein n=1 Tax=Stylonychia lemnae TaxID=5949 RepID=A0A078ADM1_STYLE|nr:UNKNOWN [Stylonychia lemnae]|eukprot:CDW80329.1 UNKNOWN [Stylonychia lemnae]